MVPSTSSDMQHGFEAPFSGAALCRGRTLGNEVRGVGFLVAEDDPFVSDSTFSNE